MWRIVDRFTETPLGKVVYRNFAKPVLSLYRSRANPDLPPTQRVTAVQYQGKTLNVRHFRQGVGAGFEAVKQCFHKRQYDFPHGIHGQLTQRRYDEIVAQGKTPLILDCGANIGASALWFSLRYPQAHIVAIEPAADNFELLKINTAAIDTELIQAGIASTDGVAHLDASHGQDMGYRTTTAPGAGPTIPMVSVATILARKDPARYTPFLLKIDIEGAESDLFTGDTSAIDRFPLIIVELHDWLMPGQRTSAAFFRFHAASNREFCMQHENIASVTHDPSLLLATSGFSNGEITL